ncbi:dolichyl-phosphate-mannose-protein mannosyltransferase [Leptospira ryugenii]|uniref:Dolichyl-phosphate-mannose-protein mannosyltransferase n=1 Tax=Leptospira ryugenii TaxID=1917863 RepID=A0A2P2DW66_9LEPT|nr:dolichyl-phosphate-mannose-protein mannosyltransferase [Leptospira ryugenii]
MVKGRLKKDDLLYFFSVFIVSFILVLLQAPNHGDHLSPRYLFGVYPSILFFTAILYKVYHDQLQKKVKLLVYGLTIITFLFSVKELYKGILFIKTSDKVVRELTERFRSRKESVLVFGDLALPKNLQTIYFEKRQFYVKPEELQMFLNLSKIPASEILYLTTENIGTCVKGTPICKDAEWMTYGLYRSK